MASTPQPIEYVPLANAEDERGYAAAIRHAFNTDPERTRAWWGVAGRENLRVVRDGGRTVGGLVLAPMGQFFGGRSVRNMGIAGVAVDHAARGRGVARRMMTACLQELAREGWAVSTLYASTASLYRSVGYELAGGRHVGRADLSLLPRTRSDMTLREATVEDDGEIERLARAWAAQNHGFLDRGPYMWTRIRDPKVKRAEAWVVESEGRLEGYAYLFMPPELGDFDDLILRDWAATGPGALDAIVGLLAGHATMWKQVSWNGAVADPLVLRCAEAQRVRRESQEPWLLRIVDLRGALETRGWPTDRSGELAFELEDELLPHNAGRWTLRVEGGRGELNEGGEGDVRLDARGIAALYSGYATAEQLSLAGLVHGRTEALAAATSLFASPAPCMLDFF